MDNTGLNVKPEYEQVSEDDFMKKTQDGSNPLEEEGEPLQDGMVMKPEDVQQMEPDGFIRGTNIVPHEKEPLEEDEIGTGLTGGDMNDPTLSGGDMNDPTLSGIDEEEVDPNLLHQDPETGRNYTDLTDEQGNEVPDLRFDQNPDSDEQQPEVELEFEIVTKEEYESHLDTAMSQDEFDAELQNPTGENPLEDPMNPLEDLTGEEPKENPFEEQTDTVEDVNEEEPKENPFEEESEENPFEETTDTVEDDEEDVKESPKENPFEEDTQEQVDDNIDNDKDGLIDEEDEETPKEDKPKKTPKKEKPKEDKPKEDKPKKEKSNDDEETPKEESNEEPKKKSSIKDIINREKELIDSGVEDEELLDLLEEEFGEERMDKAQETKSWRSRR
jgi:hypothetical protein